MFGTENHPRDGDPRVAKALDDLGIIYDIDGDGHYRFGFHVGNNRSQIGLIQSATYDFAGIETRDVFSVGLRSSGPFDARTSNLLLLQNSQLGVGSWAVIRDARDNHIAIFRAKIAADLQGKELHGILAVVLRTADAMEQRLVGSDDF